MRSTVHAAVTLGLLLILCFCSACTSQSPPPGQAAATPSFTSAPTAPTEVPGLSDASPALARPTGFEEAKRSLDSYNPQAATDIPGAKTVYRMQADGMDSSGAATVWSFTVRIDETDQILTYDGAAWRNSTIAPEDLPGAIDFGRIVTPGELFAKNQNTLAPPGQPGSVKRDLLLADSLYTVTITSGSDMSVYRFNATTGVLIV